MYRPTIGLEIHAELSTRTKMFCDSANDPNETRPNVNVCPVCLAHPGTLPVINREAVRQVLRIGVAIGGTLAEESEFDRKSYFYPDIPKGYQISQYALPLIAGGSLALSTSSGQVSVAVTRVHLEEDTARSMHAGGKSLVDFNRAGIPLMELVTEPVIHDAETAGRFARELQLLLKTLGASEANLEKGEMRIEANISVSAEEGKLGTKVEVKNLNSFRSVERAIAFEVDRQIALIDSGEKVVQETRGWDESKQTTFHQRFKEGSADYRYFPEPDLPKLFLSEIPEFSQEVLRASLPELPWNKRNRLMKEFGLKEEVAELFLQNKELGEFFEKVISGKDSDFIKLAVNYMTTDLVALLKEKEGMIFPDANYFIKLIEMIIANKISSRGAKDILLRMVESGGDPESIAEELNLVQIQDTTVLKGIVDAVVAREENAVLEYKNGKQAALQYLVGKAMQESRGAGNPEALREILLTKLNSKH